MLTYAGVCSYGTDYFQNRSMCDYRIPGLDLLTHGIRYAYVSISQRTLAYVSIRMLGACATTAFLTETSSRNASGL
jgi:hypothetical protein